MDFMHYRVTAGPMIERLREIYAERTVTEENLSLIAKKYGATEALTYNSGDIAGFVFDEAPDTEAWKKSPHGWLPKVSSKKGKPIAKNIEASGKRPPFKDALKVYGLGHRIVIGEATRRGCVMHEASIQGHFDDMVFFVRVPYTDEEPYESEFEDMIPCKEWEMLKHIDERKGD